MSTGIGIAALLLALAAAQPSCQSMSHASSGYNQFPIRDAEAAIAIAKKVCAGKADPGLSWQAELSEDGKKWFVDTEPSIKKSGDPLWTVDVPVAGPLPTKCWASMYDINTL